LTLKMTSSKFIKITPKIIDFGPKSVIRWSRNNFLGLKCLAVSAKFKYMQKYDKISNLDLGLYNDVIKNSENHVFLP